MSFFPTTEFATDRFALPATVDLTEQAKTTYVARFAITAREPVRLYKRGTLYLVACSELGAHRIRKEALFGSVDFDVALDSFVFSFRVQPAPKVNRAHGAKPDNGERQ